MQYSNGIRRNLVAVVAASAALMVAGCESGGSGSAGAASSPSSTTDAPSGSPGSATSAPATEGTSAVPAASVSSGAGAGSGSAGGAVKTCAVDSLEAAAYQAADRPAGTGTGAAVVEFTNVSSQPCVLKGHPSVAGAGNGSPEHNAPLSVTRAGTASPVKVSPGGKAWVKLTFVQVQGEADGYCESGADPVVYPTLVVGLPGSGSHQVALKDGQFAECDNKVTVTAASAVKPS
ncbi:DUF4232 domain-containing protein [Streptomyces sp. NPDC051636]|uniref:DUF4232 domain-containing protein n=1 Tax=Streptomyces sp. NPDC051636 TaxID=3365663 RepID=UPI0037B1B5CA